MTTTIYLPRHRRLAIMDVQPDPQLKSGTDASDLRDLADQYRIAAAILDQFAPRGAMQMAPFRLTALQSIELYLNALLLRHGHSEKAVRSLQHKFGCKLELAAERGFKLDSRTVKHLADLEAGREYLISRYQPTNVVGCSPANRISATLKKLGDEVHRALAA